MHAVDLPRDQCPSCGGKLTAGVTSGRCAPCLLRLGLDRVDGDALDRNGQADGDDAEAREPETEAGAIPAAPGRFADYEMIEAIGRGAMGVVFKARQRSLDRLIALKVLDQADHLPADAAKRFRIEASAAAALRHPGIVTIHEVGVHQGRHYLAMDLIEGPTLATLVAQQLLPADRAARLLALVADAIQCAHERGILHRDLKPSNILVDTSDQPRIADFGLAKRMHTDADMTIPGNIMGSPNYMSPEQARGTVLGPASDVHALGAVLYHCLSGRPPFVGQTVPDTLHHVIHAEPVALRLLVAGMPRDLDTITLKCLEKDPAKRYADARSLADDLRRFLRREPISARPAGRPERVWRWCRRRPAVASLTAATALLVLAVAVGSPIAVSRIRAERERAEDHLYAADMNLAQQAVTQNNRTQARALLERHRPTTGKIDRRGFEWRYLWTQSEADEREIVHAPTPYRLIVGIPGTSWVATGNTVWDTGPHPHAVFSLPRAENMIMAFDVIEGALLVSGTPNTPGFAAWSMKTRQSRELLCDEIVHAVALSADGRWMATGSEKKLRLWERDENSWRPVADRSRAFADWHNAQTLVFSRDGSFLVSGTGDPWADRCALEFWSVPGLKLLPGLRAAPRDVSSLAVSRDGRHLVTGSQFGEIRVWDLMTMTERGSSMRVGGFVADVEFSPTEEDVFATVGADRNVRLWSLSTGGELVVLQGPANQILALSFSDDGRAIFTVQLGGRIATWDTTTRRRTNELIASDPDRPDTLPLGISADSAMLATIDETGELRYWDLAQRRELKEKRLKIDISGLFKRDFAPVMSRELSTLAMGTVDGQIQLWHLPGTTPQTWNAHAKRIRNIAISPDGRMLASIADDRVVKLWNIESHTLLAAIPTPGALVAKNGDAPLVWSSDGQTLAIACEAEIMLHDTAGRLLFKLDSKSRVFSLRFSPDDRLLISGQRDQRLAFWDPRTGALLDMISTSHRGGASELCFSPDGRTLVTVAGKVMLWSVATRQEVSSLPGHNHNSLAALFSPDGNLFVTADFRGAVRLWSALTFEAIDAGRR